MNNSQEEKVVNLHRNFYISKVIVVNDSQFHCQFTAKHIFKKIIALFLLAAAFTLTGCSTGTENNKTVDLWYIDGIAVDTLLGTSAAEYSKVTYEKLRFHAFADENALAEAMNNMRPDMLLCTASQAAQLEENGRIVSFLPLGYDVLLSCGSSADNFDALFSSEKRISAESFADVLYAALIQNGTAYKGIPEDDLKNENYVRFYNIIADCAFEGRAVLNNSSSDVHFMRSSNAVGRFDVHPFPVSGSEKCCLAQLYGLAVIEGGREGFSNYLSTLDMRHFALDTGLIPVSTDGLNGDNELSELLIRLGKEYRLVSPESEYLKNRNVFEEYFRSELSRVAGYAD